MSVPNHRLSPRTVPDLLRESQSSNDQMTKETGFQRELNWEKPGRSRTSGHLCGVRKRPSSPPSMTKLRHAADAFSSVFLYLFSWSARQFLRVTPDEFERAASAMGGRCFGFCGVAGTKVCERLSKKKKIQCLVTVQHGLKLNNNLDLPPPIILLHQKQIFSHLLSTKQQPDRSRHI